MANVGPRPYNQLFSVGDGAARRVPVDGKNVPGGAPAWGDAYVVYNPIAKKNFSVKYGFASAYESTEYPATKGRSVAEALGPPLDEERADGRGTSYQQFHRGYLSWTQEKGVEVHLDVAAGHGWARKLPSSWGAIAGVAPQWGDYYWTFDPKTNVRAPVLHGFAEAYGATHYPESNGRPLLELLGPAKGPESFDGVDGSRQEFVGGTLSWNPREGVRVHLGAAPAVDGVVAKKAGGSRPLSLQDLAALGGAKVVKKTPRLRIAPSPTGYLHIGNAWIGVINFLMAKKLGGEFLLRIEDTDPLRSKPEYTKVIEDSLRWLGLKWDGEVVFQSQRGELYQAKVKQLLDEGKAYRDPKTGAVFFKMPKDGPIVVHDRVKGRVEVPLDDEQGTKDFMLLRPDGSPMFLLANTVDDGEQGITHVIRGEGHLQNAARQACLFRALGYEVPELYHLPHIVGEDGSKLSKREGASSVLDFAARGIDPEVLLDHLSGLGMRSSGGDRVRTLDELVDGFDRLAFAKTPSRIGLGKLLEKQKKRIAQMDTGELRKRLEAFDPPFMAELGKVGAHALAEAAKDRASTYEEATLIGKFVRAEPRLAERAASVNTSAETKATIAHVRGELARSATWTLGALRAALESTNRARGTTFRTWAETLQWALTGDPQGIPLENTMAILGREETLRRIDDVLAGRAKIAREVARPEAAAKVKTKAGARPGTAERVSVPDLANGKLAAYLRYAKHLGAPIEDAKQDASGWWVQRFEHGIAGDHGQIQLHGRPFWMVGGKLDTHLRYRELVGDPTGEAYQDPPNSNNWVQRFDHGVVSENGQILIDGQNHWLTGGKLDAWLKARALLGDGTTEAYHAGGVWTQTFERGQTDDTGAIRLFDHRFWIYGAVVERWLANREALGRPVGEAIAGAGGVVTQEFEHGKVDARGKVELRAEGAPRDAETADRGRAIDGALVREKNTAPVYLVAGGAKLHVPNEQVFARMGLAWANVLELEPGTLRTVAAVPREGTLLREADRPEVWVMRGGVRRHIPTMEAFNAAGFRVEDVKVVPDGSLGRIAIGAYA